MDLLEPLHHPVVLCVHDPRHERAAQKSDANHAVPRAGGRALRPWVAALVMEGVDLGMGVGE